MRATGIVRRIDDLGRIVVPKEIRRTLRIREGAQLLTTLSDIVEPCNLVDLKEIRQELFVTGILRIANRVAITDYRDVYIKSRKQMRKCCICQSKIRT